GGGMARPCRSRASRAARRRWRRPGRDPCDDAVPEDARSGGDRRAERLRRRVPRLRTRSAAGRGRRRRAAVRGGQPPPTRSVQARAAPHGYQLSSALAGDVDRELLDAPLRRAHHRAGHTSQAFDVAEECPNLTFNTALAYDYDMVEPFITVLGSRRVVFGT